MEEDDTEESGRFRSQGWSVILLNYIPQEKTADVGYLMKKTKKE